MMSPTNSSRLWAIDFESKGSLEVLSTGAESAIVCIDGVYASIPLRSEMTETTNYTKVMCKLSNE